MFRVPRKDTVKGQFHLRAHTRVWAKTDSTSRNHLPLRCPSGLCARKTTAHDAEIIVLQMSAQKLKARHRRDHQGPATYLQYLILRNCMARPSSTINDCITYRTPKPRLSNNRITGKRIARSRRGKNLVLREQRAQALLAAQVDHPHLLPLVRYLSFQLPICPPCYLPSRRGGVRTLVRRLLRGGAHRPITHNLHMSLLFWKNCQSIPVLKIRMDHMPRAI